jgi:streptomycin 6-kinase
VEAGGSAVSALADEAARWLEGLERRVAAGGLPFEGRLAEAALPALRELPGTQGEAVLLHQDQHAGNALAALREPWLAIDPKPLAGEREFGVAPIVRSLELGHSERAVRRRFDRLVGELGLDRERARGWTIAQTLAWASDSAFQRSHLETARWVLQAG